MRAVVDAPQPLRVDVAVDLGGRKRAVPEQLLDRAQVGAALEQVRGERVSEAMRMRYEPSQRRGVEAAAACREEEGGLGAPGELGARVADVAGERVRSFFAERDDALLAALAADVHALAVEV